jgi:hypothetical protein
MDFDRGLQTLLHLFLTPPKIAQISYDSRENRFAMRFLGQADAGTRTPDPLLTMDCKGGLLLG